MWAANGHVTYPTRTKSTYSIRRCDRSGSRVSSNEARHRYSEEPWRRKELEQERDRGQAGTPL